MGITAYYIEIIVTPAVVVKCHTNAPKGLEEQ